MGTNEGDCRVVVVGAGAGGTLVATHLVTALSSRFRVELVDPAPTTGRGQAYSTTDDRHLLNVPASGMSAFPRDPDHFLRWLRNHHDPTFQPHDFAPRARLRPLRREPADDRDRVPRQRPARTPSRRGRRRRRAPATGSSSSSPTASGSRRAPSCWRPAAGPAPTGRRRAGRRPPTHRRPVDPGDPRGRRCPPARHRADHGRPRHQRRPARTAPCTSSRATTWCPDAHVLPTTPPVPPPPGITRTQGLDALRSTLAAHVEHTVDEHRRLARRDRRPPPGHRPAVAGPVRGRQAPLHRRGRPHLGRAPAPDGAGHRAPLRRHRPRGPPPAPPRHHRRRPRRRARPRRHPRRRHRPCASPRSSTAPARSARSPPTRC